MSIDITNPGGSAAGLGSTLKTLLAGQPGIPTYINKLSANGLTTLSFTSIPQTFDELLITGRLKSTTGNTGLSGIRVNNDSGANYQVQLQAVQNGRTDSQLLTQTQMVIPTITGFNNWSFHGSILDYADTVASKQLDLQGVASYGGAGGLPGSGGLGPFELAGVWGPSTPAAITRLDFNFAGTVTSGWIAIYGLTH
jgi:hypothetical protein